MVRQQLLIDVEEAVAVRLVQHGRADQLIIGQAGVEHVIGGGLGLDHAGLFRRAATGVDRQLAGGVVDVGLDHEGVGRVGLKQVLVDGADVQVARLDDGEGRRILDQGVEANAQARAVGQVGAAADLEAAVGVVGGVQGDDQIAVGADVQVADLKLTRMTRIQRALGDVDVQLAVAVGQLAGHHGAAADGQAVGAGSEGDVAGHRAVADVQHIGARTQADVAADGGFIGVGHAVLVGVRQLVVGNDHAILHQGDARAVGADVHGDGRAGLGHVLFRVGDRQNPAGVVDRSQRAGLIAHGDGVALGAVHARRQGAGVAERRDVGALSDQHARGHIGRGTRRDALNRAGVDDAGNRRARADQHAGAVAGVRRGGDRALVLQAAGQADRLARAADLNGGGVDVLVNAGGLDGAAVDQRIGVIAGSDRAQCDGLVGRADQQRRRAAEGADGGRRFLSVGNAVAVAVVVLAVLLAVAVVVLVAVFDAVAVVIAVDAAGPIGRRSVEQNALGDVARDADSRAALQQVVGVQVLEIGCAFTGLARGRLRWGRCGVAIAGAGDGPLNLDRAVDSAVDGDADRVFADGGDAAQEGDVARDVAGRMDAVGVIADDADLALAEEVAGQRGLDGQARRIVALDLDRAGRFDADVSDQRGRARDADAVTIRAVGERAVQVAVLVVVLILLDGVRDVDGAADGDVAGVAAVDQDARGAVGGLEHVDLGAGVQLHVIAGIQRHGGARGHGDRTAVGEPYVVGSAVVGGRGADGRGPPVGNDLFSLNAGSDQQGSDRNGAREQDTHS